MTTVKRITEIKLRDDMIYTLGRKKSECIVEEIVFRRDGILGINKGVKDEAHYLVRLVGELNDKNIRFRMLPAQGVEVAFVEEEVEEKKDDIKIEKVG